MADKTTKKQVKDSVKTESSTDLNQQLDAKRHDLLEALRSHASGELVNPQVLKSYRKDIARLLTQINERKGE